MTGPLAMVCALTVLCAACSEELPRRALVQVALPMCASSDPSAEPTFSIDLDGRVYWPGGLWKEKHPIERTAWLDELEVLLRNAPGRPTLAIDSRHSFQRLNLILWAAHRAGQEIMLLTQHRGERHAIPIAMTEPPPSSLVLQVWWGGDDIILEHGTLRPRPEEVVSAPRGAAGEREVQGALSARTAEVFILRERSRDLGGPLKPPLRLLCAGRARVDRVVVRPDLVVFDEAAERDRRDRE